MLVNLKQKYIMQDSLKGHMKTEVKLGGPF